MHVAGSNGIGGLNDFPFFVFVRHGVLDERFATPLKAAKSPGRAESVGVTAAFWSAYTMHDGKCFWGRGPGGDQRGFLANGAVAIDAVDFDGGSRRAEDFPVAVIVLREMTIVALHDFFDVNIG